jgi:hypothetical protein
VDQPIDECTTFTLRRLDGLNDGGDFHKVWACAGDDVYAHGL